jgi:hypothetical protein
MLTTDDYQRISAKLDILLRQDAGAPCGRGWVGTKPGCKRVKKGEKTEVDAPGKTRVGKGVNKEVFTALEGLQSAFEGKAGDQKEQPKASKAKTESPKAKKEPTKAKAGKGKAKAPGMQAKGGEIDELRKSYKPKTQVGDDWGDDGKKLKVPAIDITTSGKADPKKAAEIKAHGQSWNPSIVVSDGDYKFKAIGDRSSEAIAATRSAGIKEANVVIVPNDPKQIAVAKALDVPDKQGFKPGKEKGSDYNTVDRLMLMGPNDLKTPSGKGHGASDAEVESAAKLMLKNNAPNWVPVMVKESGDKYEVVGNHFAYDVARKAGIKDIRTIVVPSDSTTGASKGRSRKAKTDAKTLLDILLLA